MSTNPSLRKQNVTFQDIELQKQDLETFKSQAKLFRVQAKKKQRSPSDSDDYSDFLEKVERLMNREQQEAYLRDLLHTLVQPIIELAKRNIDHNAKKNEKFVELDKEVKQLTERWLSQDKEVKDLKKMQE